MLTSKRLIAIACTMAMAVTMLAGCGASKGASSGAAGGASSGAPASSGAGAAAETRMTVDQLLDASWEDIEKQAKEEGKLTFTAWSDEEFFVTLANAFEKKYGIDVEVVIADQSKVFDKVLAEKESEKGSFDLMMIGGNSVPLVMGAELMAGPMVPKMRTSDKLEPQLCERVEGVPTNGYLVPAKTNQTGLLYNPRTVSNPPRTWDELEAWIDANPMKFGMCIPEKGGSGQAFLQTVIGQLTGLDQYYGDTEVDPAKTAQWDVVWQWFRDRKDKITLTASNNDSISRLNQGELDLVVAWDDNAYRVMKNGELFNDAKLYIPEFGMPGGGDCMCIAKNAPNPAAAMLMMDFVVSDEGQQLYIDVLKCGTARVDMDNPNTFLTEDDMQRRMPWIPAVYKTQAIKDFTTEVMMKQ